MQHRDDLRDHRVFVADGVVGVADRAGEAGTVWVATGAAAPWPVHTYRSDGRVVLLVLTPSVECWTIHSSGRVEREVLDLAPRHTAHTMPGSVAGVPQWLWNAGDRTVARHDLTGSHNLHHSLRPGSPGDFVVVRDTARPGGAWLVCVVHDASGATDLRVCDAHDLSHALAVVRTARPLPRDLRCTWTLSTG